MSYDIHLVNTAKVFSIAAHGAIGQKRKYTGEDYIVHPSAVVDILMRHIHGVTAPMLAAAWLHDVVEDTKITREMLELCFGLEVADLVSGLTNVATEYDGNREVRRLKNLEFLKLQNEEVQTIKIADMMHNTASIVEHDKAFAKIYLREKVDLINALTKAPKFFREMAMNQVEESLIVLENYRLEKALKNLEDRSDS